MVDSHAHLCDEQFDEDRADVIGRAQAAGVQLILCPGTDVVSSRMAVELAHQYDCVVGAAGIHPHDAETADTASLAEVEHLAGDSRCVAVGETGLDYYYENSPRQVQREAFEAQLEIAARLDLPVIVHCRDAFDDCLAILAATRPRGVMHCFSGNAEIALKCCDLGMMISFAGQVTYKKSEPLREAARAIPSKHLLIETDSPYLAPQTVRGKRNEPAHLSHTAKRLAEVLDLSCEDVEETTATNARALFGV